MCLSQVVGVDEQATRISLWLPGKPSIRSFVPPFPPSSPRNASQQALTVVEMRMGGVCVALRTLTVAAG